MENLFYTALEKISNSFNPLYTAWHMSCKYLQIDNIISQEFETALFENVHKFNNLNSYHDQFHFAEVMYVSSYLLKHEFSNQEDINKNSFPLLLASMFHDFQHLGRPNKVPYELEIRSIDKMINYFKDSNLDQLWIQQESVKTNQILNNFDLIEVMKKLIIGTEFKAEPELVRMDYGLKNNKNQSSNCDVKTYRLKQLLIESDILLSCLTKTGFDKTNKILKELNQEKTPLQALNSWENFLIPLKDKHFISNASKVLNINEQLSETIKNIESLKLDKFRNNKQLQDTLDNFKLEPFVKKLKMR